MSMNITNVKDGDTYQVTFDDGTISNVPKTGTRWEDEINEWLANNDIEPEHTLDELKQQVSDSILVTPPLDLFDYLLSSTQRRANLEQWVSDVKQAQQTALVAVQNAATEQAVQAILNAFTLPDKP